MDFQTLHQLSKTELHCHLDGSLSLSCIRQLAKMIDRKLPATDDELRRLVQAPADSENLGDYLKAFDFVAPLLQTKKALQLAAYDVVEQAAEENVRYIEIRFAPVFSLLGGLSLVEATQAVIEGLHQGMATYDIMAKALVCGMRQLPNTDNQTMFKTTAPLLGSTLVGGDFAGNEADFPTNVCAPAIKTAQSLGVPLTFHAGECHCPQNIAEAVRSAFRGLAMPPLVLINRHSLRKLLKLAPQLNFASRATSKRKPLVHSLSFRIRRLKKLVPKSPLTLIIEQSRIPR